MKRILSFVTLIFVAFPLLAAQASDLQGMFTQGLDELGLVRGDDRLCVLTNAAYVAPHVLDAVQNETACSMGRGNLLFYHSPSTSALRIALFRRDTRDAVILTGSPLERVRLNISGAKALIGASWKEMHRSLGNDAVPIVSILNAWADGAPWDYLKCAEFHNHSCAGICSGYLLAKYIQQHYPLSGKESYLYIAAPSWCKEDALQVLLDVTPGKRRMRSMDLSDRQKTLLPSANVAGILIIREDRNGPGTARILTFDWSRAPHGSTGPASGGMKPNPISWADRPETYIQTVFERRVSASEIDLLSRAGADPYQILGYLKTQ